MEFFGISLIVFVILALLGAAAQTWGVDTRDYHVDTYIPRAGVR